MTIRTWFDKVYVAKRFSRKVEKTILIPNLKSRSKHIRKLSISHKFKHHVMQRIVFLRQHTSIKTTQKHYTRAVKI